MAEPFLGEIRMFAGNFAPIGWAMCNGQLLPISQNDALFALIGTTYGGDGVTTFALPDLQSRIPVHMGVNPSTGSSYLLGHSGGTETVTLVVDHLPAHSHRVSAQTQTELTTQTSPAGAVWGTSELNRYSTAGPDGTLGSQAISHSGGNQPHDNMMPYLAVTFIIALEGIYPSQS